MNKRKVKRITLEFADGTIDEFIVDATFFESINSRKKYGFTNVEEWAEYFVSWVTYIRELPEPVKPPKKVDREALRGKAWCNIHMCEPTECFKIHNPTAYSGRHAQWDDIEAIRRKQVPKIFQKKDILDFGFEEFRDIREGYSNGYH